METQYFERPGGTLAFSDFGGSGQLVLLLPGMGALRSEYRYLAPQLSQAGFRAVTVDLRGHGESSVPWDSYNVPAIGSDILALVDHFGGDPAHIVGTSKAAASVVWAAAENPNAARSVVLIGGFVREVKVNPLMAVMFWLMMHNPWRVRAWAWYYGTIYPSRKPPDFGKYIKALTSNLKQPGRFEAVNAVGNSSAQPSEVRLEQIGAPTLVIMGTKDPDFGDATAEGKYIAEHSGGELQLIEGAGHYPQTEMPEQTNPIIIEFIDKSAA